MGRQQGNRWW
jgi:hypothetical protein